jgi:hypothetical protein
VKVIKNAPARRNVDPGKTPGSAEVGRPNDDPIRDDPAGKTPGNADG